MFLQLVLAQSKVSDPLLGTFHKLHGIINLPSINITLLFVSLTNESDLSLSTNSIFKLFSLHVAWWNLNEVCCIKSYLIQTIRVRHLFQVFIDYMKSLLIDQHTLIILSILFELHYHSQQTSDSDKLPCFKYAASALRVGNKLHHFAAFCLFLQLFCLIIYGICSFQLSVCSFNHYKLFNHLPIDHNSPQHVHDFFKNYISTLIPNLMTDSLFFSSVAANVLIYVHGFGQLYHTSVLRRCYQYKQNNMICQIVSPSLCCNQ